MADAIMELKLRSYAKINLSLDITGIRDDGYHTVETVMHQVSLYDEIFMEWEKQQDKDLKIIITNSKPYLPTDQRNLAYRAALAMAEHIDFGGTLKIHIEKHIPVAAGLGGGSSNAAAVMIGLNRLWKLRLNTRKLCKKGAELGADVPFCILTQNSRYTCALGKGIGDELTPVKRGMRKHVLLAKPAFGVSTKEVFKGVDEHLNEIDSRSDEKELIEGLALGDYEKVYGNMINVLENYTLKSYPEVRVLKEKIKSTQGVKKVLMSGSGPTVMGIYDSYKAAKKACLQIRREGYEAYWLISGKEIKGESLKQRGSG